MSLSQHQGGGTATIPIERTDLGLMYVAAELDGHALRLIIDTGANRTILDQAAADRLGLDQTGPQLEVAGCVADAASEVAGQAIRLGPVSVPGRALAVLDLGPMKPKLSAGDADVDGILGADVLTAARAVIDYGSCQLHLRPPNG